MGVLWIDVSSSTTTDEGLWHINQLRIKYSIFVGAPLFKKVTVFWIYLNLNLLSEDEHTINRRIGRSAWEPRSNLHGVLEVPENCSREACEGRMRVLKPYLYRCSRKRTCWMSLSIYNDTFFGSTRVPANKVKTGAPAQNLNHQLLLNLKKWNIGAITYVTYVTWDFVS